MGGWTNKELDQHFGINGIKGTVIKRPAWLTDEVSLPRPVFATVPVGSYGTLPCVICGPQGIIYVDKRQDLQAATCEQCGCVYTVRKTGMSERGTPRFKYVFNELETKRAGLKRKLAM